MKVSVRIEPEAEHQIEHLGAWWRANRPAAQSLKRLLRITYDRIASAPLAAPVYTELEGRTIRRVLIKKTPYMVYYYVDEDRREAVLISVWSAQRGEGALAVVINDKKSR